MPNFMQILETFDGSADDRATLEQFARDFPWEVEITDADYAAATARWRRADDAVRGLLEASPSAPTPSGDPVADAEAQLAWAGLSWWHAEAQASAIEAATAVWALRPP